jgi:hypothetical protein
MPRMRGYLEAVEENRRDRGEGTARAKPMTPQTNEPIGHIMVAKPGVADPEGRLGDNDWARSFDVVEVSEAAWMELHRREALDALQVVAEGLVGRWEEAWFSRPALLEAACMRELSRLHPLRHALLHDVAVLARAAEARGSAVIFVIF